MRNVTKIIKVLALVWLLALVRLYEYTFFYDPFMHFFGSSFHTGEALDLTPGMFFNLFVRFMINTALSLLILWVVFEKRGILRFSAIIYLFFLVTLFPVFVFLMYQVTPEHYLAAFYVRRFLAHPVLILLLLPSFYYYTIRYRISRRSNEF